MSSVLLTQKDRINPLTLAKALAAYHGAPVQDHVAFAKACWGIVAEGISDSAATTLARHLQDAKIPATMVGDSALRTLPSLEEFTGFRLLPNPAFLRPAGTFEEFNTEKIQLIAAAAVPVTNRVTTKTVKGPTATQKALKLGVLLTTGVPIPIGKTRMVETTQESTELNFYVDVFFEKRRYRANAGHFNFAYLGDRKVYQGLGNFKLFLADLATHAPQAIQNHGTTLFLKNGLLREMGYTSLEDLDRESRWHLTRAA